MKRKGNKKERKQEAKERDCVCKYVREKIKEERNYNRKKGNKREIVGFRIRLEADFSSFVLKSRLIAWPYFA